MSVPRRWAGAGRNGVLAPVVVLLKAGGLGEVIEMVRKVDPRHLDFFRGTSWIGIVSLLAWGLGYVGQPHILARFMSASSFKTIPAARRISMTWMILCLAGAMTVGFFGIPYFAEHPEQSSPVTANHETVFIVLSQLLFNPWIAGILLAAILAAVMSRESRISVGRKAASDRARRSKGRFRLPGRQQRS